MKKEENANVVIATGFHVCVGGLVTFPKLYDCSLQFSPLLYLFNYSFFLRVAGPSTNSRETMKTTAFGCSLSLFGIKYFIKLNIRKLST